MASHKVDGLGIQREMKARLAREFIGLSARLAVVLVGENPASVRYVKVKRKFGREIGVDVFLRTLSRASFHDDILRSVHISANDPSVSGVIVQLPLPPQADTPDILDAIPPEKDVDALGRHPLVMSPVARAIGAIFERYDVSLRGVRVAVVGHGRLVGKPVSVMVANAGAHVSVVRLETPEEERQRILKNSCIIISGVGKPNVVTPDMISDGVVLIDAGVNTSIGRGGDIHPDCYYKADLYSTPEGGVGAVTLGMLFDNLLRLIQTHVYKNIP